MRKTRLWILAAAALLGLPRLCPAQDSTQNLVTVALSGYDELKANLEFVGKLAGRPELAQGAEGMLKMLTQGEGLAGVDTQRAWGLVVGAQGQQSPPSAYAFVPVSDLKKVLSVLAKLNVESKDIGDGVFQIATPAQPVYVRQTGGWAFVAASPEALKDTPADPAALLGDLPKNYDLAVRASVKNIPEPLRRQVLASVQMGVVIASQRRSDESDEAYALRTAMAKRAIERVTTLLSELDELTLGFKINRPSGTTYLDFAVTARAGTKTAEHFAQMAQAKTNFAGFDIPGAAVTANWAGTISDSVAEELRSYLANARAKAADSLKEQKLSAEELKLAAQVLGDVMDVAEKTIANKKADAAAVLLLKPEAATLVAGSLVADGAKLQKVVQQLAAEAAKNEPDLTKFLKLDAEVHQGVHFHMVSLPVPDPDAVKYLGGMTEVVLGIGEQAVYVAAGRDAAKTLKQVIDQSKAQPERPVPPLRIVLSATPIAEFLAAAAPKTEVKQAAAQLAALLRQSSGGADHLTITAASIANGVRTRIEVEQGLLKVLPALWPLPALGPGAPGIPAGTTPPGDSF